MISVPVFNKFHPVGYLNYQRLFETLGTHAFVGNTLLEKRAFVLLALPQQMSFLTIFNENGFFKTQDTRLEAIVTPNKG